MMKELALLMGERERTNKLTADDELYACHIEHSILRHTRQHTTVHKGTHASTCVDLSFGGALARLVMVFAGEGVDEDSGSDVALPFHILTVVGGSAASSGVIHGVAAGRAPRGCRCRGVGRRSAAAAGPDGRGCGNGRSTNTQHNDWTD